MKKLLFSLLSFFTATAMAATTPSKTMGFVDGIQSQRNYILNGNFENQGLKGWATYANTAQVAPTTGTGGSPSHISLSTTTSSPLDGVTSMLITNSGSTSAQGEGWSYDFTIDPADAQGAKFINIFYNMKVNSGTFVFGSSPTALSDVTVWVYDKTNATVIQTSNFNLTSTLSPFVTSFQAVPTSTSYRLIFQVSSTNTAAWTLMQDMVQAGPAIGIPTSTTPVASSAYLSGSNQTVAPNNSAIKIALNSVAASQGQGYDYTASWDTVTNNRWTAPVAGVYSVTAAIECASTNVLANAYEAVIYLNGSPAAYGPHVQATVSSSITTSVAAQFNLKAGDYLELFFFGSGNNSSNHITVNAGSVSTYMGVSMIQNPSGGGGLPIGANAYRATNQTGINPNGSLVKIAYNSVVPANGSGFDTTGSFDTVNNRYVAPVAGIYNVTGFAELQGTNILNNTYQLQLLVNGVFTTSGQYTRPVAGQATGLLVTAAIKMNAGDYVETWLFGAGNNSSSTLTAINTSFMSAVLNSPSSGNAPPSVNFLYTGSTTTVAASGTDTTVIQPTKVFDSTNSYNTGNGKFTAPIAGAYHFCGGLQGAAVAYTQNNLNGLTLNVNGTAEQLVLFFYVINATFTQRMYAFGCADQHLNAGDTVALNAFQNSASTSTLSGNATLNYFSGYRTGN